VAGTERAATSDPGTEHRASGGAVRVVKRGQGFEAIEDTGGGILAGRRGDNLAQFFAAPPSAMTTDTATDFRVRENRLRRVAHRQGLTLQKSRARDPRAITYGTYQLVDLDNYVVYADWSLQRGHGLELDDVEMFLVGGDTA